MREVVELMARGIWAARLRRRYYSDREIELILDADAPTQDELSSAAGAIEALNQVGLVIVPKEPTEAMAQAGNDARDPRGGIGQNIVATWQAMIDAALNTDEPVR